MRGSERKEIRHRERKRERERERDIAFHTSVEVNIVKGQSKKMLMCLFKIELFK